MKKRNFNNKYGLTKAVLNRTKNVTRDVIDDWKIKEFTSDYKVLSNLSKEEVVCKYARYKVGDIVAIGQAYKDIISELDDRHKEYVIGFYSDSPGWSNKMFVRADLMPHQIRITDVKVERLKDITDEDCLREGILQKSNFPRKKSYPFYFVGGKREWDNSYSTPRQAFAALIDKVSGKGTWERNPWVFVYEFELVK
ncbi:MAG: hypothetical protein II817_03020 [Bacteroidales bacterium]|nr:hypothetical protein [Bacteroidales bacterium]